MLWLRPEQARTILDHARRDSPFEACGLILGRQGEVLDIIHARNVDPQPATGFVVAPEQLFSVLSRVEQEGLDFLGVYHSHPAGPPIPSARDLREAYYPDIIQLIVGLGGETPEIAAWRLDNGRVSRADLVIQADRPDPAAFEPAELSFAQRVAIVTAGIIAIALVLVTALSLLPPAELPT